MKKLLRMSAMMCIAFSSAFVLSAQSPRGGVPRIDDGLAFIRGGSFSMGSPESEMWREEDEVLHRVRLNGFYMSTHEVSQKDYRDVMGTNPSKFKGDDLPVENVSWYDAVAFCNALSLKHNLEPAYAVDGKKVEWKREANGYRLPSEAEWEYACRAGTATPFNTGGNISVSEANYFGTYPYTIEDHYFSQEEMDTSPGVYRERTVSIGGFKANPWGVYDMHGNVSEWCYDRYGAYPGGESSDPNGPAAGYLRVCRGGGWNDFGKHLRSAFRSAVPPDDIFPSRGFRIVRNAE